MSSSVDLLGRGMAASLASPSSRNNQQADDEDETRGETQDWNDVDHRPQAFGKVFALHAPPGADDDGEEGEETKPHRAGDDGGEDFFTPGRWWRFKG